MAFLIYAPTAAAQLGSHFDGCISPTGRNASLIIPLDATLTVSPDSTTTDSVATGDELAVLTPEGACAGTLTWTEEAAALAVWEDDPMTEAKDGFAPGDTLTYRLWDASSEQEFEAYATSYDDLADASGLFATDAVYFVDDLAFGEARGGSGGGGSDGGGDGDGDEGGDDNDEGGDGEGDGEGEDGGDDGSGEPAALEFVFEPNYPNPFATNTTFRYAIPEPAHVRLDVYDLLGRRVATLADEDVEAGWYEASFYADGLASGPYIARIAAGPYVETQQITIIR